MINPLMRVLLLSSQLWTHQPRTPRALRTSRKSVERLGVRHVGSMPHTGTHIQGAHHIHMGHAHACHLLICMCGGCIPHARAHDFHLGHLPPCPVTVADHRLRLALCVHPFLPLASASAAATRCRTASSSDSRRKDALPPPLIVHPPSHQPTRPPTVPRAAHG